ncbi:hypothetical protein GMMP13_830043 [Candidatus Magnetomoraceae bacterium gMMP-13]
MQLACGDNDSVIKESPVILAKYRETKIPSVTVIQCIKI